MGLVNVSNSGAKVPVMINSIRTLTDRNNNEMAFITIEDYSGEEASIPVFASYYEHIGNELITGKVHFLSLFRDGDDQILFGSKRYIKSGAVIKRMVKRVDDV